MKVYVAEGIGTATLVLFSCGSAVLSGASIGSVGISIPFGLALLAMAYAIRPISGCHMNPDVSLAARPGSHSFFGYALAQFPGAASTGLVYPGRVLKD